MIGVYLRGVGLWGPGLEGWAASRPVLAGEADYVARERHPPTPPMLSPTERRRSSLVVRLALAAAEEARAGAAIAAGGLRSVFATSNGDGAVVHAILEELACGETQISPTQFHNSVHNAAAGYWSIGQRSRAAADCLGCHDATAAAGVLKAAAEVAVEGVPVLLCAYDAALPAPLDQVRPTSGVFAAAFVLSPAPDGAIAELAVRYVAKGACAPEPVPGKPGLDPRLAALAQANPAARLLELLAAIAGGRRTRLALPLLDASVAIEVNPCSTATPFLG